MSSADGRPGVSVLLGRFGDLIALGLGLVLDEDRHINVIARDVHSSLLTAVAPTLSPHVIVVDDRVAQPTVLSQLKAAVPACGIVVLVRDVGGTVRARLEPIGVICLDLDVAAADIVSVITLAAHGTRSARPLTPREKEVLECLSERYTHAEIARKLHISLETARSHTASIRRKLGVRRNHELSGVFDHHL
jgi:DNA-binding CsgD family transcriptional regulator